MAVPVRALTRLALAVTIVAAVLLMHGLSAEAGCTGGATMSAASTMTDAPQVDTRVGSEAMTPDPRDLLASVANAARGHGQVCVSTSPRLTLAAVLALLLALAGWTYGTGGRLTLPLPPGGRRRRAPPVYGRSLLTALGVSRT